MGKRKRKVGDRFCSWIELRSGWHVIIHELQERDGQHWNTPIGELGPFTSEDQCRSIAAWIR